MADLTNPAAIPAEYVPDVKAILLSIGPEEIPDLFPTEADGSYKTELTNTELAFVFERITRKDWRRRIKEQRKKSTYQTLYADIENARAALQDVDATVEAAIPNDPFGA